jgi:nucleoid-associated protein YgaU
MGKLEKLIVLAVLFAAAIVLAISLNRGKGEVQASDPLTGAQELLEGGATEPTPAPVSEFGSGAPATNPAVGSAPAATEKAPSLLLDAGSETNLAAKPASPQGESASWPDSTSGSTLALEQSDPSRPILMESQGLRPSFMDEYRMYTVAEGDTWSSLAQRFYQDGRYTRNLHLANEDLAELTPGKDILVPVFDLLALDAGLKSGEASAPTAAAPSAAPAATFDQAPTRKEGTGSLPPAGTKLVEYEVRAGDTLSDLSLAVFGTATRWQELLDANKDVLQKPEQLRVGMKLKIPAGGKLPTTAKPAAKKAEPKPKTAPTDKAPATASAAPKKKKVL